MNNVIEIAKEMIEIAKEFYINFTWQHLSPWLICFIVLFILVFVTIRQRMMIAELSCDLRRVNKRLAGKVENLDAFITAINKTHDASSNARQQVIDYFHRGTNRISEDR